MAPRESRRCHNRGKELDGDPEDIDPDAVRPRAVSPNRGEVRTGLFRDWSSANIIITLVDFVRPSTFTKRSPPRRGRSAKASMNSR